MPRQRGSQVTDNQFLGGIGWGLGENGRDRTWSQPRREEKVWGWETEMDRTGDRPKC